MKTPISPIPRAKGFALVVTISLLVLLSVIALGFLSLSAVTLRSGSQDQAQMEARANARLALAIAIGELQKQTGADTRITAPADIVESNAPRITGVWRSWEGLNHEKTGTAAGRPKRPSYGIKTQPYDPNAEENGRFLTWLISGAREGENITNPSALAFPAAAADGSTVALLAEGTLGTNPGQIHVQPQSVHDNTGAIAWWVSPENQKARLAQPYSPRTNDVAGLAEMGQSHTITNPAAFGLSSQIGNPELHKPDATNPKPIGKALSRESMALIESGNAVEPEKKFHDFTTDSTGLLTNTATGGWRKDLSLLAERWDQIYAAYPGGRLPLFRYSPAAGATSQAPKPVKPAANVTNANAAAVTAATPVMSNLYPWSNYSIIIPPPPGVTSRPFPNTYHAAAASWESLKNFATAYKNFTDSSGVIMNPNSFGWDKISNQKSDLPVEKIYNFKHTQRLYPHIARFQFVVYTTAVMTVNDPDPTKRRYQLVYKLVPFFTLWNPYNVSLEHTVIGGSQGFGDGSGKHVNFLGFGWRRSPPGAMAVVNKTTFPNPDLVPNSQYKLFTPGNFQVLDAHPGMYGNNANPYDHVLPGQPYFNQRWVDKRTFGCWLPEGKLTFKPGEVKMFSPEWSDPAYGLSGVLRLREGYNPGNIIGSDFNGSGNLTASQRFWFLYKTDRITQPYLGRPPGNGFSLSFGNGAAHFGANGTMPTAVGDEFHNITALTNINQGNEYWPPAEVDEIEYSVGELVGVWVPLFSSSFGPRMTIGTGPGTEQNRPTKGAVQNNALAAMVLSDPGSGASKDHPANNTFDFAYHSLSITSTLTPNLSTSKGFIATGYQSGDGLSRLVMVDIPLRPMASLVELQGWNPRGQNPYPPFQMNLIGNSDSTPTIPQDQIVPSTLSPDGVDNNLMHDDAYCANHLLFDDWFLSTIAPDPSGFGNSSPTTIDQVYRDFLQDKRALVNRAYRPIAADSKLSDSEAATRITQIINHHEGWLKSASRFQVEGLFNINSTSVDAWEALLGRAKSLDQIAIQGADQIVAQDVSNKHVVTRGAVATDIEAGTGAGFGGQFANASEFTGFRTLSDAQIHDLATKIVEQVRLRGPFLSLSEFMNRQLSNNEDLALAGAVQTALNQLSQDPMAELSKPANFLSDTTMNPNDDKLDGVGYVFEKAAEGDSAYGVPGWIRQADVLRPIAPILTARDDTFTIRAYGDARDGAGQVTARAWCEAVVSRTRDFVNEADAADSINPPANADSIRYGRRYAIVSFRWLHPGEV